MIFNKGYIFTDKVHPKLGIMSFILGILSIATFAVSIYLSYCNGGESVSRYGVAGGLASVYLFVGLLLGVYACTEKESFKIFPILGILLNLIAFMILSLILYAGAYVD